MSDNHPIQTVFKRGNPTAWLVEREWLLTNGLGGYASGTIGGLCTRRFHGYLVAALDTPFGRTMYLNHLREEIAYDNVTVRLSGDEGPQGGPSLPDANVLESFYLEAGLPVWRYSKDGVIVEKRVVIPHRQNTTLVTYHLLAAPHPVQLSLTPSLQIRAHDGSVEANVPKNYRVEHVESGWEIFAENDVFPPLRVLLTRHSIELASREPQLRKVLYRVERARGYDNIGYLWSPGTMTIPLVEGETVSLAVSTEPWDRIVDFPPQAWLDAELERRRRLLSASHDASHESFGPQLVYAADQFIVCPRIRATDETRAQAWGHDARTIIAGYHWFTDWGRDTMISLDGLTLATGRHAEAADILRTFASYVKNGLIPNMFPEHEHQGLYHTADATLWFFHALQRYLEVSHDSQTLQLLLPTMRDILACHVRGTDFGIGVDPNDGLLKQGADGYQLTWMDAKCHGWVVTPRRGKAVEINALFYNALRITEQWARQVDGEEAANEYQILADRVRTSFNARFWYEKGRYLYDVVDGESGDDPSLRPNQLFAISLPNPVLDESRWGPVVESVHQHLYTPVGLRSLAPDHPDYKPTYDGDLRDRDGAYHQGTVWAWLIGPFIDAWIKVHPEDRGGARRFINGFAPHLADACVGTISEIFDAEAPFHPRGCVAQAWSVAEVLRTLILTSDARA